MRTGVVAVVVLAVVGVVGALAVLAFRPPSPAPGDLAEDQFSAGRAEVHLREIAQRPHPIGTVDNERVRRYIVDTAEGLGAVVREETDQVVVQRRGVTRVATTKNIVAEVRGTAPGEKVILLLSHHDSVPTGPGAADDGAAVAAMLEAMRALRSTPVANTVRFVFTDGEEVGLLGAEAYVRRHGTADVGAVLNFEARGGGGPVWMFQTGPGSSGLVSAFGEASSRPIANSLAVEVYQRMPNSTDFTVFAEAGTPGLNSAFIERVHHYHAPTDDLAHLDRGSVQHHGETILGLVRALGDSGFEAGGASVYFDLFSRFLVHYPVWVAYVLAALTVVALGVAFARARPSAKGTGAVAAASVGALVAAGGLSVGVWWVVSSARDELAFLPLSEPYDRGWFVAGFAVLALAVLAGAVRLVRGRSRAELVAGPLVVTAVLLVVTVVAVPGASFLFQWPLLAAVPALWFAGSERVGVWLAGAGPLVAAAIYPPLVGTLLVALGMPLVAVGVVFALLAGVLLVPVIAEVPRPAATVLVPLVAAVALLASGVAGVGFDREEPRPDSLVYLIDGDGARWLSPDPATSPWTAGVLGAAPERVDLSARYPVLDDPVLTAPAPRYDLPLPTAEVVGETAGAITARIAPSASAWRTQAVVPAGCRVGDTEVGPVVEFYGGPAEITCATAGPLRVELTDHWIGLPAPAAAVAGPRPPESTLVPSGTRLYDSALVGTTVTLQAGN